MLVVAIALMLAMGGNAIIGKLMGEKKDREAKEFFTLIYIVGVLLGLVLSTVVTIFSQPILNFLGASGEMYPYAQDYLRIFTLFIPFSFMQIFTQNFFITAGKPTYGFITCLFGGIANIVLDYVFIVVADMGISGAALATGIGYSIPGIFGLLYFSIKRKSALHFVRPKWQPKRLLKAMSNGMSELVSCVSVSITTLLFNKILLDMAGESGIAAISVILYIQMLQSAINQGLAYGISPIISYKYGEQNHEQLQKITKIALRFLLIASFCIIAFSMLFAESAVGVFISQDSATYQMAVDGMRVYSIAYFFMGYNIFLSAFFTALSNGKISAILASGRSLVFIVISLLTLPLIFGISGVWLAVPIAEGAAILMGIYYFKKYRPIYNY